MKKKVLVLGATGSQGGAVARHLLRRGHIVRVLTRDSTSDKAKMLRDIGAQVFVGNFESKADLEKAMNTCDTVFSMQNFWETGVGLEGEQRQANNIIQACLASNISHVIQSSIAGCESAHGVPHIFSKKLIEDKFRASGLNYTFIKTVFFMDSIVDPKYKRGIVPMIMGCLDDVGKSHFICMDDFGAIVARTAERPEEFSKTSINVASDILYGHEIKSIVKNITGKKMYNFKVRPWLLRLAAPVFHKQMAWNRNLPWSFTLNEVKAVLPELTSFETFVVQHQQKF
jgi:uncharacterized protein YbjT (DUF2867 family)